ncbi:MAG: hypothetical protein KGL46_03970 [Hyphomicrobiales bacterium]|nr:hypothetical protein [Hyphomicrobiales bacterium]
MKSLDALFAESDTFNSPFKDAIDYHRQKINLPTRTYRDIEGRAHDHAFVVAGATKDDLLADLNKEVDNAIAKGETLEEFSKRFDEIALKNGWLQDKNEKVRAWRARVVYETNLRTSYQAGRLKQMRDPDVVKVRPYWKYVHGDTRTPLHPRPLHLAWDGLILRADDPWWDTHYPPNGWFCSCGVRNMTERELKRAGKDAPDEAPDYGSRKVEQPGTGEMVDVPNGVDPGWDHAPGADWLASVAPAPDAPVMDAKPVEPAEAKGFLDALRKFFGAVAGGADHAGEPTFAPVVLRDPLDTPIAISPAMFKLGGRWIGSPDLTRALPDIAKALTAPDEIRIAFAGDGRKVPTRYYLRDGIVVAWSKDAWSFARGAAPGETLWTREA